MSTVLEQSATHNFQRPCAKVARDTGSSCFNGVSDNQAAAGQRSSFQIDTRLSLFNRGLYGLHGPPLCTPARPAADPQGRQRSAKALLRAQRPSPTAGCRHPLRLQRRGWRCRGRRRGLGAANGFLSAVARGYDAAALGQGSGMPSRPRAWPGMIARAAPAAVPAVACQPGRAGP